MVYGVMLNGIMVNCVMLIITIHVRNFHYNWHDIIET
jgi:hypothetical protein